MKNEQAYRLIEAAYPIPHDEGCYLDPEYGDQNFGSYLDQMEFEQGDDFESSDHLPFCNCGTDELNTEAAVYLSMNATPKRTPEEQAAYERRPDDGSFSEQEGEWYR